MSKIIDKIRMWSNIYKRIRYFKSMFPLSVMAKDLFLFPYDYYFNNGPINTVRNLQIVITHKCNIRCEMCYIHEELHNNAEMPLEMFKSIVDEFAASKTSIQLTGGEPFTHPHLAEMVEYAKRAGLSVQVFTNGTLMRPEICDRLVDAGLDYLNATLLGDEKTHSLVARVPGTYEKLISNLEYLAKRRGKTKLILNYTLTPQAVGQAEHALAQAERLGLDGVRLQHTMFLMPEDMRRQDKVMAALFGTPCQTNELVYEEDISGMADAVLALRRGLRQSKIPVQWAPSLDEKEIRHWYSKERFATERKCLFSWRGIMINADGSILPCSKIHLELGRAGEQKVRDAWNASDMLRFRAQLKKKLFPACSRCCKL